MSQLQAAHVLRQSVGFGRSGGTGGDGARRPFAWNLHGGSEQVDLFAVDVLHVVLRAHASQGAKMAASHRHVTIEVRSS